MWKHILKRMNDNVKFEKLFVTPAIAEELLSKNEGNRKVRNTTVAFYVDQMRRGQWKEDTGEPIKISPDGRILDGQHRLLAVVSYGEGIYFHVATNIPEDNFDVLDTGLKRAASDSLQIVGIPNSAAVAGAVKNWFVLGTKSNTGKRSNASVQLTTKDIISEYQKRPEFWQKIVREGTLLYRKFNNVVSPTILMGWYAIFSDIDEAKADLFFQKLCNGLFLESEKDPVCQLRNILNKDKMSRLKMSLYSRSAYMVKTWNYYFRNKQVAVLRFDEKKDDFPTIDRGGVDVGDNATAKAPYKKTKKAAAPKAEVNFLQD